MRFGLAATLAAVGVTERALDLLEGAVAPGEFLRVTRHPVWDPIRDHPRFRQLQEMEVSGARVSQRD
jgi:hypothetical protein